jgi:hypothetical protein
VKRKPNISLGQDMSQFCMFDLRVASIVQAGVFFLRILSIMTPALSAKDYVFTDNLEKRS